MNTRAVLARKIFNVFLTLLAIWTLNFFLFHMLPGDPTYALLPQRVPEEVRESMRATFGLDKPLLEQYFVSLFSTLKGDFGVSWFYRGQDVWDIVMERMKFTLLLVGTGTAITSVVGVKLGVLAGARRGSYTDVAVLGTSLAFYAMPAFWLSMVFIMTLAEPVGPFPTSGISDPTSDASFVGEILGVGWHMVLPVTAFVLVSMSEFVLMVRNTMVDVLTEDYVTTARAKGLTPRDIINKHAVPNAMLPTIATLAMFIGWVVTGAIMIEVVFSWPGVGTLTWDALRNRDFPLLQGVFIIVAVAMLVANFIADIIYTYVDPRVRL